MLVAKCAVTTREMLTRACRNLADGRVNVLGCVLNDLDLSKQNSYGYRYYYSHYGYHAGYGEGADSPSRDGAVNQAGS